MDKNLAISKLADQSHILWADHPWVDFADFMEAILCSLEDLGMVVEDMGIQFFRGWSIQEICIFGSSYLSMVVFGIVTASVIRTLLDLIEERVRMIGMQMTTVERKTVWNLSYLW